MEAELPTPHGSLGTTQSRAASGYGTAADFQIRRLTEAAWEIHILSSSARNWAAHAVGYDAVNEFSVPIKTDLAGVNDFTLRARQSGYRMEYIGPREVIYL